ncbi:unnamed protein product (macronuclear) [Paramecium tetraurelia]|uniref:RING-type domain-containing protein n=1 Tax=Paramecium tetraurelia TaxID=5888 RepID=A0DU54_PARTE|nr:uncharacterized protein GSPATT00020242001 [Paramecium tetraurelia]CAK86571.1 unnamed protein product [Paramecium tetraurelia]|eukprot:XP_001453968.1 hypothetical protein (macronuclear) [Paramecium tetraurelia strain d4-2]
MSKLLCFKTIGLFYLFMILIKFQFQTPLRVTTQVFMKREEPDSLKSNPMAKLFTSQHILIALGEIIIQPYGEAKMSIVTTVARIQESAMQISVLQKDDGCECIAGYVGSDCHQQALEILEDKNYIYFYGDETQFFYLNIDNYDQMDIELKLSTNSYQGIEIILQLTNAIIIPSQYQLSKEESYIQQYKIYDTQPQELIYRSLSSSNDNIQLVFVARPINSPLDTIVSTLTIELSKYDKSENTFSIIVIIIIVVVISVAVIIIIILFFVCKSVRKRKMLRMQARLRMARLEGQQQNQITQQQDYENLYDLLTPIPLQDCNNQDSCAICLDNLNNNQEVRQTHCHHNFHSLCIREWLQKNKKECPVCRSNLAIKDVKTHQEPNQ